MKLKALRDALTPEWGYAEAKLVWFLRALLAAFLVFALLGRVDPEDTTPGMLVSYPVWGAVISSLFAFVPTQRPRTLKAAEAFTLGALLLHVAGHAVGWYDVVWYDKALHFMNPLVSVFIIFALSQATEWIWDWRKVTPLEVGIYTFAMAVTIGTLWEILEFGMDRLGGTQEQAGLVDTMFDIILDVAGALLGAIAVAWITRHGRKRGHDEISESPKRPVPQRAPAPGRSQ